MQVRGGVPEVGGLGYGVWGLSFRSLGAEPPEVGARLPEAGGWASGDAGPGGLRREGGGVAAGTQAAVDHHGDDDFVDDAGDGGGDLGADLAAADEAVVGGFHEGVVGFAEFHLGPSGAVEVELAPAIGELDEHALARGVVVHLVGPVVGHTDDERLDAPLVPVDSR